jgi:hypothetical protein
MNAASKHHAQQGDAPERNDDHVVEEVIVAVLWYICRCIMVGLHVRLR